MAAGSSRERAIPIARIVRPQQYLLTTIDDEVIRDLRLRMAFREDAQIAHVAANERKVEEARLGPLRVRRNRCRVRRGP